MIISMNKLTVLGLGCAFTLVGMGCKNTPDAGPKTDGQRIEQRATVLRQKAQMTQKGERLVADGNAMIARGKALSEQGQTIDGQKAIIDGEAKVREGTLYIRQANDIALPDAPTTVEPVAPLDPSTRPTTRGTMSGDRPM
jgi:hypothetical protein